MRMNHTLHELKMKYDPKYREENTKYNKNGFSTGRYRLTNYNGRRADYLPVEIDRNYLYQIRKLLEANNMMQYVKWGSEHGQIIQ